MNLKLRCAEIALKLNGLSARERVIVVVTAISILFFIYDHLVLSPFLNDREMIQQKMKDLTSEVVVMQQSIEGIVARQAFDPNVKLRIIIDQKKDKVNKLDDFITTETTRLIDPEKMPRLLGHLLSRQSKLTVNNVKNTSADSIYFDEEETQDSGLYKHDLTLVLEGTYSQVQNYLKTVEEMAEQIYWDDMSFEIKEYPMGILRLGVHTLSTSKELIGVY